MDSIEDIRDGNYSMAEDDKKRQDGHKLIAKMQQKGMPKKNDGEDADVYSADPSRE